MDNSQKAYWNLISRLGFVRVKQVCEGAQATCVSSDSISFFSGSLLLTWHLTFIWEFWLFVLKSQFYIYYLSSDSCKTCTLLLIALLFLFSRWKKKKKKQQKTLRFNEDNYYTQIFKTKWQNQTLIIGLLSSIFTGQQPHPSSFILLTNVYFHTVNITMFLHFFLPT